MMCSQTDPRFMSYSISTTRLCGLRSFAAPQFSVPGLGSLTPGGMGYYSGGIGGGSPGVMGPPTPGGWGFNGPLGFGALRSFRGSHAWLIFGLR